MKRMLVILSVVLLLATAFTGCTNPITREPRTDKPPVVALSPEDYFFTNIPARITIDAKGKNTMVGTAYKHHSDYTVSIEILDTTKSKIYGDVAPDAKRVSKSTAQSEAATSQPQAVSSKVYASPSVAIDPDKKLTVKRPINDNTDLDIFGIGRPYIKLLNFFDEFKANNIYVFVPVKVTVILSINDGPELASFDISLPIPVHMPFPGQTKHTEDDVTLKLFTPVKTLMAHLTDVKIQGSTVKGWAYLYTENDNIVDDMPDLIKNFLNWLPTKGYLIELVYDFFKWVVTPQTGSDQHFNDPVLTGKEVYYYKIRG